MRLIAAAALCGVLVAAVARARTPAECGAPAAMSDDWSVSPPTQQGLDPELICATGRGLAKRTEAAPHGVVVVRHGALVYEQYFAGEDMYGNVVPYNANTLHDIASITKGRRRTADRHRLRPWLAQRSRCPDSLVLSRIRRSPHSGERSDYPASSVGDDLGSGLARARHFHQ